MSHKKFRQFGTKTQIIAPQIPAPDSLTSPYIICYQPLLILVVSSYYLKISQLWKRNRVA